MERYNNRKIDDFGRIGLHASLRKHLGIEDGDKVALNAIGTIVVVQLTDDGDCVVDALGMITIPADIQQKMSWAARSELAVYHTDSQLILKTA